MPGLRPDWADVIHVSVTFTWDMAEGAKLKAAWQACYPGIPVLLGGPAITQYVCAGALTFYPGLYIRPGVTFTTRGCNNRCPWCLVPEREGKLRELDVTWGHIIQDNNLLQASRSHLDNVFAMLQYQRKAAVFSGGLDARLITDTIADDLRGLRIDEVFLACDTDGGIGPLRQAIQRLSFLPRRKLRVYTMAAYNGETIDQATARMEAVWEAGGLPFCQLYQPADRWIDYPPEWKALHRTWSRPAAMFALHKEKS